MVNETDADRIQREKDRRRAEERLRIEREHHRRLHDVEVLRRTTSHPGAEARDRGSSEPRLTASTPGKRNPEPASKPSAPPDISAESPAAPQSSEGLAARPRPIGERIVTSPLQSFLSLNPAERFDIQALNQLSFDPLLPEGEEEPALSARLAELAETLMERVKREVDDPLNAGALLRQLALIWYRRSPDDPSWSGSMPDRWGGIFAESKVSGGRLHPWLNVRLRSLHQRAVRQGRMRERVRRGLSRSRAVDLAVSRTASQQIQAEVAQALLDDLAARARKAETPCPLVRLSELAVRRQVATVNDALASLFSSSESGPFVLLHPNRYPDCDELQIRPPAGGTSGAALAFTLVTPKGTRRAGARTSSPSDVLGSASGSEGAGATGDEDGGFDAASIWDAKSASAAAWRAVLEESRQEKHRLDAPPRDYRGRAPYASLRDLLLQDAEARKVFLGVKWRGRPAGLPLLIALLQRGTIAPEVATDHEYLEAELGELSQGDPQFVPEGGTWKFPGWTVTREGTHHEGFRYRAVADNPSLP